MRIDNEESRANIARLLGCLRRLVTRLNWLDLRITLVLKERLRIWVGGWPRKGRVLYIELR